MSGTDDRDFRVRRYAVLNAAAYMRETLGEDKAGRVVEGMSPTTREILSAGKPVDWAPISVLSEITRAIADHANGDQERAKQMLITSGVYMAREATNTFFKMLLRIVTPQLFCKKLPDFWNRDFTRGKLSVVDLTENTFVCRMEDMAGFDHGPCTAAGFTTYVISTMGKNVQSTTVDGWSLERPCSDGASYVVRWT
jgi:hypothetical protein